MIIKYVVRETFVYEFICVVFTLNLVLSVGVGGIGGWGCGGGLGEQTLRPKNRLNNKNYFLMSVLLTYGSERGTQPKS